MAFKQFSLNAQNQWITTDLGPVPPYHLVAGDPGIAYTPVLFGSLNLFFRGGGDVVNQDYFFVQQIDLTNQGTGSKTKQYKLAQQLDSPSYKGVKVYQFYAQMGSSIITDGLNLYWIGKKGFVHRHEPIQFLSSLIPTPTFQSYVKVSESYLITADTILADFGPMTYVKGKNNFSVWRTTDKAKAGGIGCYCHSDGSYYLLEAMGGVLKQKIFAIASLDNKVEIFYAKTDGQIYHIWQSDSKKNTLDMGPMPITYALANTNNIWISGAVNTSQKIEIFFIGQDNNIYHTAQTTPPNYGNNGWGSPVGFFGQSAKALMVTTCPGGLDVYCITMDNKLRRYYQTNGAWQNAAQDIAKLGSDIIYLSGVSGRVVVSS